MKTKFEPSDFLPLEPERNIAVFVADKANAKLEEIKAAWREELEASGVKVWGRHYSVSEGYGMTWSDLQKVKSDDTHEALLINIRELKPQCICGEINARHCPVHQECEHSPCPAFLDGSVSCRFCGKRLKAKWELAE